MNQHMPPSTCIYLYRELAHLVLHMRDDGLV